MAVTNRKSRFVVLVFPPADLPSFDYAPTARPGSGAPHVWLWRDGERISIRDLFDTDFVLVTGTRGEGWREAVARVVARLRVPLQLHVIGPGARPHDKTGEWLNLYGIAPDGAVLVRPDGHVAWRAGTMDAPGLEPALRRVIDSQ